MKINDARIGMMVSHKDYGKGQILSINKFFGYIKVQFNEEYKGESKRRVRPVFLTVIEQKESANEIKDEIVESVEEHEAENESVENNVVADISAQENTIKEDSSQNDKVEEDGNIVPIKLNRISFDEIKEKVKQLIIQENWNYGASTISAILLGVRSKAVLSRGLDSNPLFGVFANKEVTEVEINIGVDELVRDKTSFVIKDRDSGVIKLKTAKPMAKAKTQNIEKEQMFVDVLAKENPMLLKWFDVASKLANPKSIKVSTKNYYGYKTTKGKYWITRGKTNKDFVFRYRIGDDGEIQTTILNERTKSYVGHLMVVLSK